MDKFEVLKRYFGYETFREGQETLIDSILARQDTVGIMPTGAGKSICFQIPAMLFQNTALVVSPLISLMKDQVNALVQMGIPAAYLNSSLTAAQYRTVLSRALKGQYKILYVAPERLLSESFLQVALKIKIDLLCVDEAHCVSQWGQDFRPSYLKIAEFVKHLEGRRPVVAAFTATATAHVREDIIHLLELEQPTVLTTGFDRKNLYFEVQKPKDKLTALCGFLKEANGKPGIVYCATRKIVEEVQSGLEKAGYQALAYHAGMDMEQRKQNQDSFLYDEVQIMVATNAFGMGIDKSNVAFVVHYNMPGDLESYYQEAGRAGRDGSPAKCVVFYSGQDTVLRRFLILNAKSEQFDEETAEKLLNINLERLRQMTYYCTTPDCLRQFLLQYFGDKAPAYCGNCGNCSHNFEEVNITVDAQKILSCVKRVGERYGVKLISDVLRGVKTARISASGLDKLSTFGIMRGESEKRIREVINFLLEKEYLYVLGAEYPIVKLRAKAKEVLFQGKQLTMKRAKDFKEAEISRESAQLLPENPELFAELSRLRRAIATRKGVPAFVIFSDVTLREMCQRLPQTEDEMLYVSGVGEKKLEQYGKEFLEVLCRYAENK